MNIEIKAKKKKKIANKVERNGITIVELKVSLDEARMKISRDCLAKLIRLLTSEMKFAMTKAREEVQEGSLSRLL